MYAEAGPPAVDLPAVFAVTLSAYQQQQQRYLAVWDLIMDTYEDDSEFDCENDQSARELASERKEYKNSGDGLPADTSKRQRLPRQSTACVSSACRQRLQLSIASATTLPGRCTTRTFTYQPEATKRTF